MKRTPLFGLILLICCLACQNNNSDDTDDNLSDAYLSDTYTNDGRYLWQKPETVVNLFGDLSNKTVADIGAGYGFFTFLLAETANKVIAIDISDEVTTYLKKNRPEGLEDKIEVRLVSPSSPQLKSNEADAVLLVNTYMYLDDRIDYLQKIHKGSAEGAKILITDFKKKQTSAGPATSVRVPLYRVEAELAQAGFRVIMTDDTSLEYQYIVLAEKQ
ncbi:MAG: class I SAM-dependent methyltransferase [Bacteroidota bacterium]